MPYSLNPMNSKFNSTKQVFRILGVQKSYFLLVVRKTENGASQPPPTSLKMNCQTQTTPLVFYATKRRMNDQGSLGPVERKCSAV